MLKNIYIPKPLETPSERKTNVLCFLNCFNKKERGSLLAVAAFLQCLHIPCVCVCWSVCVCVRARASQSISTVFAWLIVYDCYG